ncbi:hypothetical protein PG985_014664 [Apiospora marii]|uniref:Transmembrane protein n=1 Tax=Apiospora marii TaxID=335849 RepID=A0ABR1R538_9PEZI
MKQQHSSFFNYNITRPFPFKWFTPVAVVGGIVLTALFTFVNVAQNGYIMSVEMTADPNATVSQAASSLQWWPSYLTSKIMPTCQPTPLPVNSQFLTNQTALTYTLASVWRNSHIEGNTNTAFQRISPSLAYMNHELQNCSLTSVQIDVESDGRAADQQALTEWGAKVRTSATCQIATDSGIVFLNLTQTYDYVPETVTLGQVATFVGSGPVSRDKVARASLWWGESLMSTYWAELTWLLQVEARQRGEWPIRKGSLYFVPQPDKAINDTRFFQFTGQFVEATLPGDYKSNRPINDGMSDQTIQEHIRNKTYPNIWAPAENLAKSAFAMILADLGQASPPTMLTDPALLQTYTADFGAIKEGPMANAWPGPATRSYDELRNETGPLSVTPSVISAQYLCCQIPRMRPPSSLVVAVTVADLVFLQAAWQLYKLFIGLWLTGRIPDSDWCKGCLDMKHRDLGPSRTGTMKVFDNAAKGSQRYIRLRQDQGVEIGAGG